MYVHSMFPTYPEKPHPGSILPYLFPYKEMEDAIGGTCTPRIGRLCTKEKNILIELFRQIHNTPSPELTDEEVQIIGLLEQQGIISHFETAVAKRCQKEYQETGYFTSDIYLPLWEQCSAADHADKIYLLHEKIKDYIMSNVDCKKEELEEIRLLLQGIDEYFKGIIRVAGSGLSPIITSLGFSHTKTGIHDTVSATIVIKGVESHVMAEFRYPLPLSFSIELLSTMLHTPLDRHIHGNTKIAFPIDSLISNLEDML